MAAKKRTLWIVNYFAGNRNSGWGERHFFLAKELVKRGDYEVVIISSSYNHMFNNFPKTPSTFNFEEHEKVTFCWVRTPHYDPKSIQRFWAMWVFSFKLFFFPIRRLSRPNYILISSMPLFPILPGWYLKWKLNAEKLIFEVRDLWPLTPVLLGNVSAYNPMILLMKWFERFAYRNSDEILCLLPRGYLHINPIARKENRTHYLPNGISNEVSNDEPIPFSLELIPPDKFIIGYAGTLGVANAMEYVVEAAKLMMNETNVHFIILGDGYLKDRLIRQAQGLSNITFIPKVKKGQVSTVIERFDAGIISWHNSPLYRFGVSANKFFDYMLSGKPILVAGDLADNPVEKANCGIIVKPENPEAICEGVRYLRGLSVEDRKRLGLNGVRYVKDQHSYHVLADRLNSILVGEHLK